jgi:hypothetical protein
VEIAAASAELEMVYDPLQDAAAEPTTARAGTRYLRVIATVVVVCDSVGVLKLLLAIFLVVGDTAMQTFARAMDVCRASEEESPKPEAQSN